MSQSVTRRHFLETSATLAALGVSNIPALTSADETSVGPAFKKGDKQWYQQAYRRAVIDMHIPDWDKKFLSLFDPQEYANMLTLSKAQSVVCYCQSHVGLFNFPTKVGRQHKTFAGRNVLGEMIRACHDRGIAVQLYVSLIFDRAAADDHPEWRMRTWDGKIQGEGGRHGVLCINSGYREYVRQFMTEICQNFEFEGIRCDMTFWPWLCFCENCQSRFGKEVGGEIPRTIDWLDEKWVAFQRRREAWLVEFASIATTAVRQHKPTATVEHQSSTFPLNWMFGVTGQLAKQNDFLQGDFYGDSLQGSFVRKLLEELTPNRPFGYETSFSTDLKDHTARKSSALLEAKAAAAIADQAAFIFIDAIDTIGTVNPNVHQRMGKIFDKLQPYYAHLGGQRVRDVAIYYSMESKFDFAGNGRPVSNPDTSDSHTTASMQAARRLIEAHIPLGVVTRESLLASQAGDRTARGLEGIKLLILANVNMLDDHEADAIREWVKKGGRVYASGGTSVVNTLGKKRQNFALSDVFGVDLVDADWKPRQRFLSPTELGQQVFPEFDPKYPAFCDRFGMKVKVRRGCHVIATTTEPWPAKDASQFASIHSNPPWELTDHPEIVLNPTGDGGAIYSASPIEMLDTLSETFRLLIGQLLPSPTLSIEAPAAVEVTLFHQPERSRYVLCLVNFQKDLPNIPIDGMRVHIRVPERIVTAREVNGGRPLVVRSSADEMSFTTPRLETLLMIELKYSNR